MGLPAVNAGEEESAPDAVHWLLWPPGNVPGDQQRGNRIGRGVSVGK